jgi:TRAP-type C4-dicarboxylate transport system substrate-binding protein
MGAWLGLALLPAQDADAHGVSLDVHHALPADSAFHRKFLVPWTQKVEQESGGRIRFHLHPASTLGDATGDLYEQVREGGTDIAWTPVRPGGERFRGVAVIEFPFMVRSARGASRAVWEYVRVNDLAERDFDGVRLVAVHVSDGSQLHWGGKEPADLAGRRVAVATPDEGALLATMGAVPVEMPPARMADALGNGSAEGALLPWERASALGIDRVARTHAEFGPDNAGLTSTLFAFVMHPASYASLADDLKAVINANSGIETAAWLGRVMDEAAAGARRAAIARGDLTRVITPAERDRWRQAARAVTQARAAALEQDGVRLRPLIDSLREQLQGFDASP